jgi:DNA polymerase-1
MTCERPEKLLLIDANNLAFRVAWSHRELSFQGSPVAVLFGFFKSLIRLKRDFPEYFTIVVWDAGHKRRDEESARGVQAGIIDSAYKANRKSVDGETPPEVQAILDQISHLREEALPLVKVLQAEVEGCEADDVIYTYAMNNLDAGGQTTIVTSDKDYYQLLGKGIVVFDAMKDEIWNRKKFTEEFGFDPELWVDAGALMGDKGDNILGVPGVGQVTACNLIREFGSYDKVIDGLRSRTKIGKKEAEILNHIDRVKLAYSLKKMDRVPFIPRLRYHGSYDAKKVEEFFIRFRFVSLLKDIKYLV